MIPTLATALSIAASVWGPAPCPADTMTAAYDATVFNEIAYVLPGSCVIHLSPDLAYSDPVLRCHAAVHEWGHRTGHRHSRNPRNVMYPRPHRYYWRCRKAARRTR